MEKMGCVFLFVGEKKGNKKKSVEDSFRKKGKQFKFCLQNYRTKPPRYCDVLKGRT